MKSISKINRSVNIITNIRMRVFILKTAMIILFLLSIIGGDIVAQPPPPPDPGGGDIPIPGSNAVGTLPGNLSISPSGAATYSIPIKLPDGRAGFTPTLSLNYNSQKGNGLMGVGWFLGGLSAISRTGTNLYNEGFIDGVDFDDNDKFILDGQRLIPIDGSLTEYRTELETFSKVVVYGSDVHDPDWFEVFAKDGRIIEYGHANNSRLEPWGRTDALAWQINRVKDRQGNYIDYYYEPGYEAGKISDIKYTGNLRNSAQTFYEVSFEYDERDDINKQYISGSYIEREELLEKITIMYGAQIIQSYTLNYNNEELFPKIVSISTSDGDGNIINPSIFEWGDTTDVYVKEFTDIGESGYKADYSMGDFNGDGRTDVVCAYYPISGGNYHHWIVYYADDDGTSYIPGVSNDFGNYGGSFHYFTAVDLNGDGNDDLVMVLNDHFRGYFSNGQSFNTPITYAGSIPVNGDLHQEFRNVDLNGNGLNELLLVRYMPDDPEDPSEYNVWFNAYEFSEREEGKGNFNALINPDGLGFGGYTYTYFYQEINPINTGDYNGDGKTDILINYITISSQIKELESTSLVDIYDGNFPNMYDETRFTGDFNGDGITDLLNPVYNGWQVKFFNGSDNWINGATITNPEVEGLNYTDNFNILISDYNGDGLSDVLFCYYERNGIPGDPDEGEIVATHYDVHYSTGTSFETEPNVIPGNGENICFSDGPQYYDVNGDGKNDCFLTMRDNDTYRRILFFNKDKQEQLVQEITNGLDAKSIITYESLSQSDSYTKQTTAEYPVIDLQFPLKVVTKSEKDNGIDGFFEQTYMYEGLKAHLRGLGNLGFDKLISTDKRTNTQTITDFELYIVDNGLYDLYYYKYPSSIVKHPLQANGEVNLTEKIMETTNLLAIKNTISGNQSIYYPVVTENKQKLWDNEAQNTFVKMVTTTQPLSEIDSWGNSKGSTVIVSKNESGSMYTQTSYESSFTQNMDEPNWIIGRPDYTKVTNEYTNDSEESTLQTDYTYYNPGNQNWPLVETKVVTPNDETLYANETLFEYNIYGNITKTTTSARNLSIENNPPLINRETVYEYSESSNYNGRFLTAVTQNDGTTSYTSTNDYNVHDGTLSESTDAAGLVIEYDYSSFGRLENTSYPDQTWENTLTHWKNWGFLPLFEPSEEAVYAHITLKSDGSRLISFKDKLGRDLKTAVTGLDNNEWIVSDKLYDERGFFHKVSEPYFAGNTPDKNDPEQWTTLTRNPLNNKTVSVVSPVNTINVAYSGLETTITNMGTGVSKTTTIDPLARTKSVTDPTGTINYEYYSSGNLKSTDALGSITEMFYDDAGRQERLEELNSGTTLYTYSNFGELLSQTDNKGNTYKMSYDKLGRLRSKILENSEEYTAYNYYHTAGENGFGMLESIIKKRGVQYSYTYDNLNRLETETEKIDDINYTSQYAYNTLGQLGSFTYPSGYSVSYEYTPTGTLQQVIDGEDGQTVLWQTDAINRRGQVTDYSLGNGLTTQNNYDDISGYLESIVTGEDVQYLEYEFNPVTGNLNWREDKLYELTESFTYDNELQSRLATWQVSGQQMYEAIFANNGNINKKSDVTPINGEFSMYNYGSNRPNAVTDILTPTSQYKNSAYPQNTTYTAFNKIETMVQIVKSYDPGGSDETRYGLDIVYGPDNLRKKVRYTKDRGILKDKYYIGTNFEIEVDNNGNERKLHYISGVDGVFAIYVKNQQQDTMYYIHKDHLGSYETITDDNGQVLEKLSFDPWGRRRNPTDWTFYNVPETYLFDRGYTGHVHLDNFDLINMNGRVYDPWLGRFLSPDPFMQDITNSQDYNRYSYAFNNPLKYVDPTGYVDIDDAISSLLESDNGGYWNVGDASVTFFESDDKAKEFVNDNLNQVTEGGSGDIQRDIGTIYNSNGDAIFYDKNSGEVWNPETLSFTPGADLFPGQMFYDSKGNFANVFLPGEVEIKASAVAGDGYGDTFAERLMNLPSALWNGDVFGKDNPNVIKIRFSDAQLLLIPGSGQFNATRTILKSWKNVNWKSVSTAIRFHYSKHVLKTGVDKSIMQYTDDALNLFNTNKSLGKEVLLRDGSKGVRIRLGNNQPGGIFTPDGKIVSFWYK